ncbi:glycosyltransferase [bacterium]|nr:glycosyltransferase [bacterium]
MMEFLLFSVILLGFWYPGSVFLLDRGLKKAYRISRKSASVSGLHVSVIAALRNEENNIDGLIDTLTGQDYPLYEVILVDDNSEDETFSKAEKRIKGLTNFKLIKAGENIHGWGPKKNAIDWGIKQSQGEIILTTDADCRPGKHWISGLLKHFSDDTAAVAGYSPLIFQDSVTGRLKSLEALASGILSAAFIGLGKPFTAAGRNFAYRKDIYLKLGGFGRKGKAPAGDDDLLLQEIGKKYRTVFAFDEDSFVPSYPDGGGYIGRKRRHFSAAKRYPPLFIIMGILLYIMLFIIILNLCYGIYTGKAEFLTAAAVISLLKISADYYFLRRGGNLLCESFKLHDFMLAELIQYPYTLILQPLSFLGGFKWRGRRL